MKNIARTQSSTTVHSLVVLKFKGTDKLGKEEQERCKTESVQEVNQTSLGIFSRWLCREKFRMSKARFRSKSIKISPCTTELSITGRIQPCYTSKVKLVSVEGWGKESTGNMKRLFPQALHWVNKHWQSSQDRDHKNNFRRVGGDSVYKGLDV